MVNKKLDKSRS